MSDEEYRLKSGRVLSEGEIEELAKEAERGYDVSKLPPDRRIGMRVRLISCTDSLTKLEPGAEGTVGHIDDLGTVHVHWDDGHHLGLIPGVDAWETIR